MSWVWLVLWGCVGDPEPPVDTSTPEDSGTDTSDPPTCSWPEGPFRFVPFGFEAGLDRAVWDGSEASIECYDAEYISGAVASGDLDGDGDVDLVMGRFDAPPIVYWNLGTGCFEADESALGTEPLAVGALAVADLTGDSALDVFISTSLRGPTRLFVNDGEGRFTEESEARGAALGPVDGDVCNLRTVARIVWTVAASRGSRPPSAFALLAAPGR